jgi:hypothetical protein
LEVSAVPINRPFGTDVNGNSPPRMPYIPLDDEARIAREVELVRLGAIAASAEKRLQAQHAAGQGYNPDDFATLVHAKGISSADSIRIKLTVGRTGNTIEQVMRDLRLD